MKTPTISRNDGTTFTAPLAKLRTPKAGGGSIDWVPDDETRCASLSVKKNGTYTADGEGVYGFDRVTVSVTNGSVTGTINGVKYIVSVNDSGPLVYTKVS